MLKSAVRRRSLAALSDDVLAREAGAGGVEAFGELYKRHAGAAWGVAQAIVRNPDDASDAVAEAFTKVLKAVVRSPDGGTEALRFRPYLLTATRNAAIDLVRRRARVATSDALEETLPSSGDGHPVEQVVAREEEEIVVEVFGRLPERWRTALWLIDVEQLSTREAADVLGVEPNNAAQLAARGRARLREQFLQAHVPNHIRPVCEDVVRSLGAYLAGTATATRAGVIETHLVTCRECAERLAHVRDLGLTLRRAILPVPLLLGRRISRSISDALEAASSLAQSPAASLVTAGGRVPLEIWGSVVGHLSAAAPAVERVMAGVTAAALVVGLSTAAVKVQEGPRGREDAAGTSGASRPGAPGASVASPGSFSLSGSTSRVGPDGLPVRSLGDGLSARAAHAVLAPDGAGGATSALTPAKPLLGTAAGVLGPTLRGATLVGADLAQAVVRAIDFTGADLRGATLTAADLTQALLSGADLSGAEAVGAILRGTELSRARLTTAHLAGADLTQAVLGGATLAGADLSKAVLRQATLTAADLSGTVLAGADLRGADLRAAKLAGADLSATDLTGANLTGADLTSAKVAGVKLTNAALSGAVLAGTGLEQATSPSGKEPAAKDLTPLPGTGPPARSGTTPAATPLAGLPVLGGGGAAGTEPAAAPKPPDASPTAGPSPSLLTDPLAGAQLVTGPLNSVLQGVLPPDPAQAPGGPLLPGVGGPGNSSIPSPLG